jgi:outer membrane lipoprotein-sorting protein
MSCCPARERALISLSLTLFVLTSCSSQRSPTNNDNAATETVVSATPPFQTKEPDRYRATRTITTFNAGGETAVSKTSIARDGELRRHESETGGVRVAYVNTPAGRFVLLLDDKLFADLTNETKPSSDDQPPELSPEGLLHADDPTTSYQNLGTAVIGGRNTKKYRIVVNAAPAGNVTLSETSIWIDEDLHIPTRSETRSPDGTRVTMELSEVTLDVDRSLFQVPNDYEKVTFSELRKRLRKTR